MPPLFLICLIVISRLVGHWPTAQELKLYGLIAVLLGTASWLLFGLIAPRLFLFSNRPLREMIGSLDIEAVRRSEIPIYVAVASSLRSLLAIGSGFWPLVTGEKWRQLTWPNYLRLSDASNTEEACDWLLQSAAIPEAFPGRRVAGRFSVGGGVVDKTPILPVCRHEPSLRLAVYLDSNFSMTRDLELSEKERVWIIEKQITGPFPTNRKSQHDVWMFERAYAELKSQELLKAIEQSREDGKSRDVIRDDFVLRTLRQAGNPLGDAEFVPIIPSQSLGGFFSGTLNFRASKARRLLKLGYKDTLERIQKSAQRPL